MKEERKEEGAVFDIESVGGWPGEGRDALERVGGELGVTEDGETALAAVNVV
jgi:hypothetical protein